jgi:hypothetical protein
MNTKTLEQIEILVIDESPTPLEEEVEREAMSKSIEQITRERDNLRNLCRISLQQFEFQYGERKRGWDMAILMKRLRSAGLTIMPNPDNKDCLPTSVAPASAVSVVREMRDKWVNCSEMPASDRAIVGNFTKGLLKRLESLPSERDAALREALEALKSESLYENLDDESDEGYQRGIGSAIAAIDRLATTVPAWVKSEHEAGNPGCSACESKPDPDYSVVEVIAKRLLGDEQFIGAVATAVTVRRKKVK